MVMTDIQICNMALGNIGVSQRITTLNDSTMEAQQCNLYYEVAQKESFEAFHWPFARRFKDDLTLVGGTTSTPYNNDWQYAYRYPVPEGDPVFDVCARVIRISRASLGRRDPAPAPFLIGSDDTGRLILTNEEDPTIEYTRYIYDEEQYPILFATAMSWKLASYIAPALAKDPVKALDLTEKVFNARIDMARAVALNEGQLEEDQEASWIQGR
jgi:hypothetical protein